MLRFFLVIFFVLFSFLAVDADASDPRTPPAHVPSDDIYEFPVKILKAKYIARKHVIRVHVVHNGCANDGFQLHFQGCLKSHPMQCEADIRRHTVYPTCKRLSYTWVNFPLEETVFHRPEFSRATLTIHGFHSKATVKLPEL